MKNQGEQEIFKKIINLLEHLDFNPDEKCNIIAETGLDESTIVGTESSFIALGKRLLEFIYYQRYDTPQDFIEYEYDDFGGISAISTDSLKTLFDGMADVWPVCIIVAKDNNDVDSIVKGCQGI